VGGGKPDFRYLDLRLSLLLFPSHSFSRPYNPRHYRVSEPSPSEKMARRKSRFMSQDSDSDSDSDTNDDGDQLEPLEDVDEDVIVPPPQRRGTKRTREQLKEDATYGVWAQQQDDDDDQDRPKRSGGSTTNTRKRKDYLA